MRIPLLLLLATCAASPALAQYKCTGANGAVTFQGTPCFGFAKEQKLVVVPNGTPVAASGASSPAGTAPAVAAAPPASGASAPKFEPSVDKRMLARYQKQDQRDQYQKAVKQVEDDMARRSNQKAADIAAVQRQMANDPANAATLNTAITSINARYQAMTEVDNSRLASAKAALAAWEKAQP